MSKALDDFATEPKIARKPTGVEEYRCELDDLFWTEAKEVVHKQVDSYWGDNEHWDGG